jgi:hypothetical protein
MNELMDKLNDKNREILDDLIVNYICHTALIIVSTIAGCFIFNVNKDALSIETKMFYGSIVLLCIWFIYLVARNFFRVIKCSMLEYKHVVNVAMHKLDNDNHIPKIN